MGNYLGLRSFREGQRGLAEERVKAGGKTMYKNVCITQNVHIKWQWGQAIALARDRVLWQSGFYIMAGGMLMVYSLYTFRIPYRALMTGSCSCWLLAYQFDLARGWKTERIKRYQKEILKEDHWFNKEGYCLDPDRIEKS